MTKRLLAIGIALLFASSALAAEWTDVWSTRGRPTTDTSVSILRVDQVGYIVLPTSADDDSISDIAIRVVHLATFCMDTNFATLPGASEVTGQVQVLLRAADGNIDGLEAVLVGTLTAASPCVHSGPGDVFLRILEPPSTAGGIVAVGY